MHKDPNKPQEIKYSSIELTTTKLEKQITALKQQNKLLVKLLEDTSEMLNRLQPDCNLAVRIRYFLSTSVNNDNKKENE